MSLQVKKKYYKLYKTHTIGQPLLAKIMAKMWAFSKKLQPYALCLLSIFKNTTCI